MSQIQEFNDVIDWWSGKEDLSGMSRRQIFADKMGVKIGTIGLWKSRNSIPPIHWRRLVKVCRAAGFQHFTISFVLRLYENRWKEEYDAGS